MDRSKYNKCIRPYITGAGKSKEERRLNFCVGAKICSGKCNTREEAEKICMLPKPEKPTKTRKKEKVDECEVRVLKEAHCIAEVIDMNLAANVNSIEVALINAMMQCQCQEKV